MADNGELGAVSRAHQRERLARLPRAVDPPRCAGVFVHGRVDYRVRGIHVRLEVRWDWQAEQGDDTHQALYRGTRCRLAVRQGPAERFRPELYVLPDEDIGAALQRRIVALQPSYPGIAVEAVGSEWRIAIPDALRIGHDAAFAAFTRRFLAQVTDPASLPERERPNLLAKYRVTTEVVRTPCLPSEPYAVGRDESHREPSSHWTRRWRE